jgi:putative colanic acid biosynthesis UDP-glucose lipid carrier transferase
LPQPVPALWWSATAALLVLWRALVRTLQSWYRRIAKSEHRVAIVGVTHIARRLVGALAAEGLVGDASELSFYDDRQRGRRQGEPDPVPPVGTLRGDLGQLLRDVRAGRFDDVFIALPMQASARIRGIAEKLSDSTAKVSVVPDFLIFDLQHAHWSHVGELSSVDLLDTPFHGVDGWFKRFEDLVLGALLLAVSALPMLAIAGAIKATSPGPVLFRQRRYGLNGKVIWVLKFRTMHVAAPDAPVKQATANDPRVTRLGSFLRRSSLDELPQFLQVLTGEMSVVGPRPHAVEHNELYRSRIQGYMQRHKVKPGITGWAQVNGWRGETDTLEKMEQRIAHDLDYIDQWGVLWDLEIVARTALVVMKRTNAF